MLFRSPPLRRRPGPERGPALLVALAAALAPGATACTTETFETLDESSSADVALVLRPVEFIGDVPCSAAPGAMRSYVATLIDRTDPDLPFTHASSLPTPCSMGVLFGNVAAGRSYAVQIDGYDSFADEIGPEGWVGDDGKIDYKALRSGKRRMETADGAPVTPRWLTACGEGDQPRTIAAATGTTPIVSCDPLVDTAPGSGETALEVSPQDALGDLRCADPAAPGEPAVASFDLLPQNGLPALLGIPCLGAPLVQKYAGDDVVPATTVDFFVDARAEQAGPVVWGATCSGLVQEGLTVRAACSPLVDSGALRVDIAAALALVGVNCSGDIVSFDAELVAGDVTLKQVAIPCTEDITFGPLPPGDYTANITLFAGNGTPLFDLACAGAVAPGRTTAAGCALP